MDELYMYMYVCICMCVCIYIYIYIYMYVSVICDKSVTTQKLAFLSYWYRKKRLQMSS